MSMPSTTTLTGPTRLASIAGLPAAAHEVLHRELLHIHSSLHLILLILRGPLDSVTPSIVGTITCPRLRATLRALETSLEQIRRSTCTTLVYTDELCSTLGLPHPTGHSTSSPTSLSSPRPLLHLFPSPPSPPGMTTMTTTTAPSPPHAPPSSLTHSAPPSTLTRRPSSHSPSLVHVLLLDASDFSRFLTNRTFFCSKSSSCSLLSVFCFGLITHFHRRLCFYLFPMLSLAH